MASQLPDGTRLRGSLGATGPRCKRHSTGSDRGLACIVTIPFGVAALRIALFGVWPFGRAVVPKAGKGVGSSLGNILWFVLGGWYLALLHLITGVLLGSRRLEFERHQDGLGSALRRARRGRWSSWRPRSAGNALVSAGESLS